VSPPSPVLVSFGRRVRRLRMAMGVSQEALGERSGIHRTYVGGIERGERNISLLNIAKLADGLGVGIADLFPPDDAGS
jgi:transcriptional regulator with XRE-family HTH domain